MRTTGPSCVLEFDDDAHIAPPLPVACPTPRVPLHGKTCTPSDMLGVLDLLVWPSGLAGMQLQE